MAGEVFLCVFQAELLCLFSGQSIFSSIFWIKADDIMMGFDLIIGSIFVIQGVQFPAFHVDDIETEVSEMEKQGIKCEPIRYDDYTHKKMTFFFDPDGLPLELRG